MQCIMQTMTCVGQMIVGLAFHTELQFLMQLLNDLHVHVMQVVLSLEATEHILQQQQQLQLPTVSFVTYEYTAFNAYLSYITESLCQLIPVSHT